MVLGIIEHDILKRLKQLSVISHLVNTLYVDKSTGEIETTRIIKEYESIRNITEKIEYKLKSHRILHQKHKDNLDLIISDLAFSKTLKTNNKICECMSENLNRIFISELKSFRNIQIGHFNFFNRGFWKKTLFPKKEKQLIEEIIKFGGESSWIIVPNNILNIINKSILFEELKFEEDSIIHRVGKLGDFTVFLNPDEKENDIYYGNYDSITLLLNKEVKEKKLRSSPFGNESVTYTVEYLFLESGNTRLLHIS